MERDVLFELGQRMKPEPISFPGLRGIGFRIASSNCSNVPHMVLVCDRRMDTAFEVAPCNVKPDWSVWLRSDLAHSRARFVFLRSVRYMHQLEKLIEAVTDEPPARVEFDQPQFDVAIAQEAEDCRRRFSEYCVGARWGSIPGG